LCAKVAFVPTFILYFALVKTLVRLICACLLVYELLAPKDFGSELRFLNVSGAISLNSYPCCYTGGRHGDTL
jgi:hypothetical protein